MYVKVISDINNESIIKITLPNAVKNRILQNTKCPENKLVNYYRNKQFILGKRDKVSTDDLIDNLNIILSNVNEKTFWNTILTNNGKAILPREIKESIKKYKVDTDLEEEVINIFIRLAGLITDPLFCYTSLEEDLENDDDSLYIRPNVKPW